MSSPCADPSSPVAAQFVPDAGMIGTSLTDAGAELLGQRRGLDAYLTAGKTMGIPILYPVGKSVGRQQLYGRGRDRHADSRATTASAPTRTGCPSTACWPRYRGWRVTTESANELTAELDFGADPTAAGRLPVSAPADGARAVWPTGP